MQLKLGFNPFNEQYINIWNNLAVLVGHSNAGKSNILDHLEKSFQGKGAKIYLNDKQIIFGDYNVVYLKDVIGLDEEIKMTKSSDLKQYLLSYINEAIDNNDQFNRIKDNLQQFQSDLSKIINEELFADIYDLEEERLIANVFEIDLEKYIEKLLTISIMKNGDKIDSKKYSKHYIKDIWFKLMFKTKILNSIKNTVLLIDEPELYGGPLEWLNICRKIKDLTTNKIIVILTTKNPMFIKYLNLSVKSLNFIDNQKIVKVTDNSFIYNYIVLKTYLDTQNNEYDLVELKSKLKLVISSQDMEKESKIITEYLPYLIEEFYLKKLNVIKKQDSQNVLKILLSQLLDVPIKTDIKKIKDIL
ncbi:hypothetical protein [Spiroplasma endosymbiont of Amphibalanus improvisus]|uniref:hypothetical protein n=1 Tax=Spiroplasma endosymbiont of Amphibalanus improvisus TaxID=3066327 RepID=UPI00313C92FD